MCIRLFSVLMLIVNNKNNCSNMRNFLPNFIRILIKSIFINFCIMEIMLSLSTTTPSSPSQPSSRHASSSYRNFMLIDAVKLSSTSSASSSLSSRSNFGFHKRGKCVCVVEKKLGMIDGATSIFCNFFTYLYSLISQLEHSATTSQRYVYQLAKVMCVMFGGLLAVLL
jgi:hypothetical protein